MSARQSPFRSRIALECGSESLHGSPPFRGGLILSIHEHAVKKVKERTSRKVSMGFWNYSLPIGSSITLSSWIFPLHPRGRLAECHLRQLGMVVLKQSGEWLGVPCLKVSFRYQ